MYGHLKRCAVSLIIREIQIKAPRRYHLTPIRMAILKKKRKKQKIENTARQA